MKKKWDDGGVHEVSPSKPWQLSRKLRNHRLSEIFNSFVCHFLSVSFELIFLFYRMQPSPSPPSFQGHTARGLTGINTRKNNNFHDGMNPLPETTTRRQMWGVAVSGCLGLHGTFSPTSPVSDTG
jgi:hypothetical protein